MRGFDYKKAVQALNYFAICEGGTINKMKALKLVWLSDRYHLRKYGRTITGDTYFALPYGPVASNTRDVLELSSFALSEDELLYAQQYLKKQDKYDFTSLAEVDKSQLSKTDYIALGKIHQVYGSLSAFELSEISHMFPEWLRFESALNAKISSREMINMDDFFINYNDNTGVFQDVNEQLEIVKEIYHQSISLSAI